jgi:glycosyltransferase involved in cell wall biosynthesis
MTGAVRRWSQGLVNAGAEAVIVFDRGIDPPVNGKVEWVRVKHVGRTGMRFPIDLERAFRGADLVVLHSGWVPHGIRAASVARKMNIPYLLEPRGAYDPHIVGRKRVVKKTWWTAWERDLVMNARAIHVFFESEQAHVRALGYPGPFVVASNGVEVPPDSAWDGGSGRYLLWLGRFDPEHKGLDLLVQAVSMIPEEERRELRLHGPDWRSRKQSVGEMIDSLGLNDWVKIGDAVYGETKRDLLTMAAGFVYPSRWDACPNSVLESVAMGVPTLGTTYPLATYLASHGGALSSDVTPSSIAGGLKRLLGEEASGIGAKGARIAAERFNWDQVARSWLLQVEALL